MTIRTWKRHDGELKAKHDLPAKNFAIEYFSGKRNVESINPAGKFDIDLLLKLATNDEFYHIEVERMEAPRWPSFQKEWSWPDVHIPLRKGPYCNSIEKFNEIGEKLSHQEEKKLKEIERLLQMGEFGQYMVLTVKFDLQAGLLLLPGKARKYLLEEPNIQLGPNKHSVYEYFYCVPPEEFFVIQKVNNVIYS